MPGSGWCCPASNDEQYCKINKSLHRPLVGAVQAFQVYIGGEIVCRSISAYATCWNWSGPNFLYTKTIFPFFFVIGRQFKRADNHIGNLIRLEICIINFNMMFKPDFIGSGIESMLRCIS